MESMHSMLKRGSLVTQTQSPDTVSMLTYFIPAYAAFVGLCCSPETATTGVAATSGRWKAFTGRSTEQRLCCRTDSAVPLTFS